MTHIIAPDSPLEAAAGAAGPDGVAAFKLSSDETRLAILLALWEAADPRAEENEVTFSDLNDRVSVGDTGNFTYHLDTLLGHVVEETGEGSQLRLTRSATCGARRDSNWLPPEATNCEAMVPIPGPGFEVAPGRTPYRIPGTQQRAFGNCEPRPTTWADLTPTHCIMHTVDELTAGDFTYLSEGQRVRKDEVMPSISLADRVGVVMGHGAEGVGAGNFILASVIDFYETLSEQQADIFEYPDFYTFQATDDPADYRMLDIYPNHKNVGTDGDAASVLRAVTDRAIDILLVPDRSPASPTIDDVRRRSAARRIESCFCYAGTGQLADHGFVIQVPRDPVEAWYDTTVDSTSDSTGREGWGTGHADGDRISQEYRRCSRDRALASLSSIGQ